MAQPYGRTGSLALSLFKKSSSDLKMLGRMAKQKERRFDFYCFVGVTRNASSEESMHRFEPQRRAVVGPFPPL